MEIYILYISGYTQEKARALNTNTPTVVKSMGPKIWAVFYIFSFVSEYLQLIWISCSKSFQDKLLFTSCCSQIVRQIKFYLLALTREIITNTNHLFRTQHWDALGSYGACVRLLPSLTKQLQTEMLLLSVSFHAFVFYSVAPVISHYCRDGVFLHFNLLVLQEQ